MVVQSASRSYELIQGLAAAGKTNHGLWRMSGETDSSIVHMVQIEKAELAVEAIPFFQELYENAAFTDLSELFLAQDTLFLVFSWQEGVGLLELLKGGTLSMERRFQLGRAILERMLVLDFPVFLQAEELRPEEILVLEEQDICFYYGFPDTVSMGRRSKGDVADRAARLFELLFEPEKKSGLYPELWQLTAAISPENTSSKDTVSTEDVPSLMEIYKQYLALAAVVTEERRLPEMEKKEPLGERLKKKAGVFLTLLKIAAGLTVLAAASVVVLDTWKETVYPVVESTYLTKTFLQGAEEAEQYTGKVEITDSEGKVLLYRGKLEDGRRTGYGTEYYQDGELKYEGNYGGGFYEGQGTLYGQMGKIFYQGSFLGGLYDGNGSLHDQSGALVYQGSFVRGEKSGGGLAYDSLGRLLYEGGFLKGRYEGTGSLYRDSELVYEGAFTGGKPNGEGVTYEKGLVKEKGIFEQGVLGEGKGFLHDATGRVWYQGMILDGKPEGEGASYEEDALLYEGSFKKGEYDGEGKLYAPENGGLLYRGSFVGGLYDGQGMRYDAFSGMPVYRGSFRLGFYDGEGMEYDATGNLKYQGNFLMGDYNGYGVLYDPATGITALEGEFRNGILVTPKEVLLPETEEMKGSGEAAVDSQAVENGGAAGDTQAAVNGGPAGEEAAEENSGSAGEEAAEGNSGPAGDGPAGGG